MAESGRDDYSDAFEAGNVDQFEPETVNNEPDSKTIRSAFTM
jgi:hypothetical protein